MGAEQSRKQPAKKPTKKEFQLLASATRFSAAEIETMWNRFSFLTKCETSAARMDKQLFKQTLKTKNDDFAERAFIAFDVNRANNLTFIDFVKGLSAASPRASISEKSKFVFAMFDNQRRGYITQADMSTLLESVVEGSQVHLDKDQINQIVQSTFKQMQPDASGYITFQQFKKFAGIKPSVLSCVRFSFDGFTP